MKRLVLFQLKDGSSITVEVDEPEQGPLTRGIGRPSEVIEEAKETFAQALSRIRPATEEVITILRGLIQQPNEIEMEFGIRLSTVAGVVLVSAATEGTYKVTMRWKHEERGDDK